MDRRTFIQNSSLVAAGTAAGIPSMAFIPAPPPPLAANAFLYEVAKEVFKELLVYAIIEGGKALWNHFFEQPKVRRVNHYLSSRNYQPVPNFPIYGYNTQDPIGNAPSAIEDIERQSSGFNGTLSFMTAQSIGNGDAISTRTAFVEDSVERTGTAAILSESQLLILFSMIKKLLKYYDRNDIRLALLPQLQRSKENSLEEDIEKVFNSSSYQTPNGRLIINDKKFFDNGSGKMMTRIEAEVFLIPYQTEKASRTLLDREVKEGFTIDVPKLLASVKG